MTSPPYLFIRICP